jgi:XTP/dITP diphosphohydrolase
MGKLREVTVLLADLPVTLKTLHDCPSFPAPTEDADTFMGNATLKALHYAHLARCWALADDSGLTVDALSGAPGVHSARYAQDSVAPGDAANNAKLILNLSAVPVENRVARFHCAMVLAAPGRVLGSAIGAVEGIIVDDPRGDHGFGYDPHFFLPTYNKTMAQLPPDQKNLISHRGIALRAIRPIIEDLLQQPDEPKSP